MWLVDGALEGRSSSLFQIFWITCYETPDRLSRYCGISHNNDHFDRLSWLTIQDLAHIIGQNKRNLLFLFRQRGSAEISLSWQS